MFMLSTGKVDQNHLGIVLRNLFPSSKVIRNARKQAGLTLGGPLSQQKGTGGGLGYLELDLWIPDMAIAFEYQDPHHYLECTWYSHAALKTILHHDDTKKNAASTRDQTFVTVPCWWDGSETSLAATIKEHRPDLLLDYAPITATALGTAGTEGGNDGGGGGGDDVARPYQDSAATAAASPIPPNPPVGFFTFAEHAGVIPNVGKLTLASFASSSLFCPASWWASEKYDGLRACWNSRKLYSRLGRQLFVPTIVTADLPAAECLDGELWFGRRQFNEAQKVAQLNIRLAYLFGRQHSTSSGVIALDAAVTEDGDSNSNSSRNQVENREGGGWLDDTHSVDILWSDMRFLVFDCPALEYQHQPYEDRYHIMLSSYFQIQASVPPVLEIVANIKCVSKSHAATLTEHVLLMDGEGTVMRRPASAYVQGRSNDVIKFKIERDAEGLIVSKTTNDGEFIVKLPDNTTFVANLQPGFPMPKAADVVTFTYSAYSKNRPTNARITHVRHDMDWEAVTTDAVALGTDAVDERVVNKTSQKGLKQPAQREAYGYWTTNECENIRKFFDAFATSNGRDPYDPQSWYSVPRHHVYSTKGGNTIMTIYKHCLKSALLDTYPNIGLMDSKFPTTSKKYWHLLSNRRRIVDGLSARLSFDPLNPDNWYNVTKEALKNEPGGRSVLKYYGHSRIKALMDIYPDIGLEPARFQNMMVNHWKFSENRRKFFDAFAKRKTFDPLVPSNWYDVLPSSVLLEKSGGSVLYYYEGSLSAALVDLYPHIGLRKSEFKFALNSKPRYSKTARKEFFDGLAKRYGFDPLVAANWYSVGANIVRKEVNARVVLKYYRGSVIRALQDLYPDASLLDSKFCKVTNKFWRVRSNVKSFFDEFASTRCFDPLVPNNWRCISQASIIAVKGGSAIMRHYGHSLENALMDVYPPYS